VTLRQASRTRASHPVSATATAETGPGALGGRHLVILAAMVIPMAAYVYGALRLGWGFDQLSAAFLVGALVAGVIGGLGVTGTLLAYIEGMQVLLPAAIMVGFARSISLVLADGRVVDTILNLLAQPLAQLPAMVSGFLMVPVHAIVHVAVPSVSGHAALTLPLFVPLADVLGMSRQVPVLAYQTGAGLTELFTPTNGALMAVLLAAKVPYERWLRFAVVAAIVPLLVGLAGIAIATLMG
jgi:uncharacterized ion transporter superfamily protein YfcC